jgi:hypothetical protein
VSAGRALLAAAAGGVRGRALAGAWGEGIGARCGEEGGGSWDEELSDQELGQLCSVSQLIDCAKGLLGALQEADVQN